MTLISVFEDMKVVYIDTVPFIYFTEKHPAYFDKMQVIFKNLTESDIDILTATLTLTEVLMKPIQAQNKYLQNEYRSLVMNTRNISPIVINTTIAIKAAELRAQYNLKTPDALHLATAIASGADAFLTNDNGFKRVADIKILILDELEL